jgi:2-keto-3-deoxy-L-rhamnonate aldolase RhmA
MKESLKRGENPPIICQIESAEAVQNCEAIAAVPGVSGLFVGRADLALSMGFDNPRCEEVLTATKKSLNAALSIGKLAGMHVSGQDELEQFKRLGANWFIVSSDQTLLRQSISSFI